MSSTSVQYITRNHYSNPVGVKPCHDSQQNQTRKIRALVSRARTCLRSLQICHTFDSNSIQQQLAILSRLEYNVLVVARYKLQLPTGSKNLRSEGMERESDRKAGNGFLYRESATITTNLAILNTTICRPGSLTGLDSTEELSGRKRYIQPRPFPQLSDETKYLTF